MGKKKYKKGIESLAKQIEIHRGIKLQKALQDNNLELANYYKKEIERLEGQLREKQKKLLPRNKRLKLTKKL